MIAKSQNIALLNVAEAAKENPSWQEYAQYCILREKGLRKEAFDMLYRFLNLAATWSLEEKIFFVKFLCQKAEIVEDADYGPLPQPLKEKLLKPTLLEWCKIEQHNSEPFRWFGKFFGEEKYLQRALEINPMDDLARSQILTQISYELYYSVHHLPEHYIGNPVEDLERAKHAFEHIEKLSDPTLKNYWNNEINEDLELVKNYSEWQQHEHPNFLEWCKENNRTSGYNITTVYYKS